MHLSLYSLKLALHDLMDKRHADLVKSRAGKYYEADLKAVLGNIDALPPAVVGTAPLAVELIECDELHDGYGSTIWFYTEAVLRNPASTPEMISDARTVRDAFIPAMKELKDKYAREAHRATERKGSLKQLKAQLTEFPLPGGQSLYDVASKFIDAGLHLSELLSARGDATPASRDQAGPLRAEAIGLMGRLRDDLLRELNKNSSLPTDLEQRVFGYVDTLEAMVRTAK
jgi:hypothetical protein